MAIVTRCSCGGRAVLGVCLAGLLFLLVPTLVMAWVLFCAMPPTKP